MNTYFLGIILACLPIYLIRFPIFGLPTTLLELLLGLFLLTVVGRFIGQKKELINQLTTLKRLGYLNYAIGLFVLAGVISTIISPDKLRALGQLKAFIIEPVLLFYAIRLQGSEFRVQIVLRWLFVGAGLVSIFGLIQYFTFVNLPLKFWGTGEELVRITSFFEHPNALALYLAPIFTFFFTLAIYNYQLFKQKWIGFAGLALMITALILTFSRGAWFAVLLICLLLIARKFGIKKVTLVGIIIGTLLFLVPVTRTRILLGLSDPSSQVHWDLMRLGFNKIVENPILGTGLHGFQAYTVEYPHNIFLTFWLEMGLIGFLSFCWILYIIFQRQKNKPTTLGLAVGVFMLTLIIHGLVDTPYFKNDLSVLFWFIVALAYL